MSGIGDGIFDEMRGPDGSVREAYVAYCEWLGEQVKQRDRRDREFQSSHQPLPFTALAGSHVILLSTAVGGRSFQLF